MTVIDRVPPGEGCSFGNAGGIAFCEIVPTIHPRILLKIPGWLMDPLGPLTIRWSYLPKALPWFLAAGRNAMPDRVKAITEARANLALRVVADFESLLEEAGTQRPAASTRTRCGFTTASAVSAEAMSTRSRKRMAMR